MGKYKIADIIVDLTTESERVLRQGKIYRLSDDDEREAEIFIKPSSKRLDLLVRENPHLTRDDCEYIETGSLFYQKLLDFNGFLLHASAVAYEDKAYLFSAPCGTGKSTHTEQWQKYFGEDKAFIVNDDKPAIRLIDDQFFVFGTPWSGKSDKNLDLKIPLQGIVVLKQATENRIQKLPAPEAIYSLLSQTVFSLSQERMDVLLSLLDSLLKKIDVYQMECLIGEEAVLLAYRTLNPN